MCIYMCVYIYIYIHMYIHIYMSESPGLHPGTLPLSQSWQPVKEEMNNKVNKVKVANCVNEGYEFPKKKKKTSSS